MLNPVALSIIVSVFTDRRGRARAVGPRYGWADPWIVGLFVLAVLALIGMLIVEPRRSEPLIDLRFFRSPPFSGAITISVVMSASLGGFLFLSTLYLQDLRHFSPLRAGLMIIPLAVGQAVAANLSGRLLASRGARLPLTLGGALLAIGGFLLVPLTAHTESAYLLAAYAIFGLGAGMVSPPVTNTAISGLPPDQVGVAGALAASARQFGISIGVAVTGSIVASTGAGFISSSHAAWAVLGGCGLVALALGVISTSSWAKAAAARNGQRLATAPIPESQGHPLPSRSADPAKARKE
jgi:predicted MFS family arabinose efflux permease